MLIHQRADFVLQKLQALYPETPVPLDHTDSFTLLIAVLLSAQCTDERVNKITPELFDRANNPTAMAALEVDEIRGIIRPCGLSPQKSRILLGLLLKKNMSNSQVQKIFDCEVPTADGSCSTFPN